MLILLQGILAQETKATSIFVSCERQIFRGTISVSKVRFIEKSHASATGRVSKREKSQENARTGIFLAQFWEKKKKS